MMMSNVFLAFWFPSDGGGVVVNSLEGHERSFKDQTLCFYPLITHLKNYIQYPSKTYLYHNYMPLLTLHHRYSRYIVTHVTILGPHLLSNHDMYVVPIVFSILGIRSIKRISIGTFLVEGNMKK